MKVMVFDIETVPVKDETISEEEWEYLLKWVEKEEDEEKEREKLSFWAFTAHLVSVALCDPEEKKAWVLYISDEEKREEIEEMGVTSVLQSFSLKDGIEEAEKRILKLFWKTAHKFLDKRLVSFNGRKFDSVFLMLRSFILGVKVSRNLLGSRFDYNNHFDLLEGITFHGIGRKYTLDFICRRLGLESPKTNMDGTMVKDYFNRGQYREIALYNLRDAIITGEIYKRFRDTLGEVLGL